jgi:NAD-dependent dihydropyrimidine dehydrogenase PreA subunit
MWSVGGARRGGGGRKTKNLLEEGGQRRETANFTHHQDFFPWLPPVHGCDHNVFVCDEIAAILCILCIPRCLVDTEMYQNKEMYIRTMPLYHLMAQLARQDNFSPCDAGA